MEKVYHYTVIFETVNELVEQLLPDYTIRPYSERFRLTREATEYSGMMRWI